MRTLPPRSLRSGAQSVFAAALTASTLTLLTACVAPRVVNAAQRADGTQSADGIWSQLVPQRLALAPIEAMSSVYDPVRARVWTFGGWDGQFLVANFYALDLAGDPTWSAPLVQGTLPSARYGSSLVYDSARGRILLFGGNAAGDVNQPLGDTWILTPGSPATIVPLVTAGTPPARYGHRAVYDPVRDRMLVLFGYNGSILGDVWQLTLRGTPTWSQLATLGTPPSARDFAGAVYDPDADRILLMGGNALPGPTPCADAWSLALAGTPTWTALAPSGTVPAGRLAAATVWDPLANRLLVLGGTDGSSALTDVEALSLSGSPVWQVVTPGGRIPAGRWAAIAAFDPSHDRLAWATGLGTGSHFLNDTWLLDLTGPPQWSQPPTANSPPPRYLENGVFDALRDRVVVFGGIDHGVALDDLWALPMTAGASWVPLDFDLSIRPSARAGSAMVLDPVRDRLVLYGGLGSNDAWTFDFSSMHWSTFAVGGPAPPERVACGSAYDPLRDRMLVFGGADATTGVARNDTWELDFQPQPHWQQLSPANPPPARSAFAMVYDADRDRLIISGGESGYTRLADTWVLPLYGAPAWTNLTAGGNAPPPLSGQAAVVDPVRRRFVLSGGTPLYLSYPPAPSADTYTFDLTTDSPMWSKAPIVGTDPGLCFYAAAVYDPRRDRMLVVGGRRPIKPGSLDTDSDASTWAYTWGDVATPTLVSFADERTGAGTVCLTWFTPAGAGQSATAQRSADGAAWETIAFLISNASSEFVLEDAVAAGGQFDYRLAYAVGGGGADVRYTADHWVMIPAGIAFGITDTGANPSRGALHVAFALAPAGGPAALELYDVRGRRVVRQELAGLAAGAHQADLSAAGGLPSGIYWLRLAQAGRVAERKVAILR